MDYRLIKKKVLSNGTHNVRFPDGTKILFHYCTKTCDPDPVTLDDSKKSNSPMELIIGKQFKLPVWEMALKSMALNEVSTFTVDKSLTAPYPFIAKTQRDLKKPAERVIHCCAGAAHNQGIGYADLNELIKQPKNLEFTFELLKVETPDMYEKEIWQMNEAERIRAVPQLKDLGNQLYREKRYEDAADKYAKAIGILENLMLKEKPRDVEWNELNSKKLPILLNYAQCQLFQQDYYSVINYCTTVLETEPDNVKAYFRRGKAHFGAWNPDEAEADFHKVMELDPKLTRIVEKELNEISRARKEKTEEDRLKFEGKLF